MTVPVAIFPGATQRVCPLCSVIFVFKVYMLASVVPFACSQERGVVMLKLVYVKGVPAVFCERQDIVGRPISSRSKLVENLPLRILRVLDDVADEEVCRISVDNGG